MAISYPSALDSLSNPTATDPTLNPGNPLDHAGQHSDLNDAIEALQTKVGINASAVVASLDNKVTTHLAASIAHGVTGAVVGTTNSQTLTGKTLDGASNTFSNIPKASVVGAPAGLVVGTTDTQTLTNKTISGGSNTITGITQASVAGAPSGAFVGTTDTQTLTNKTISGASNTLSAIAQASITGAPVGALVGISDTQTLTNKTISGASNTLSAIPQASVTNLTTDIDKWKSVYVLKGSDQSVTSSITLISDSALVVTLAANRTYVVEAVLGVTGATAGDVRTAWLVSGTVVAVGSRTAIGPEVAESTIGYVVASRASLTTALIFATGLPLETGIVDRFVVSGGASGGTLTLRFAQGTSSVTSTVMKANSFVVARPVI